MKLESIDLQGNKIEFIHDDAFQSCVVLKRVILGENRLTALPTSFGPNPSNLEILSVESSILLDIPQRYFARYPSLKDLHVMDTDIDIVDGQGLGTLRYLAMNSRNRMPYFNGHTNLEYLRLDDLNLTTFPSSNLSNMTKLADLGIYNSKLEVFPEIINSPNLAIIDLSDNNQLRVIKDLSLLPRLIELYCDNCRPDCGPDLCWFIMENLFLNTYFYPLTCASPPEFANSDITSHSPVHLRCYEGLYSRSYFSCMRHEMQM